MNQNDDEKSNLSQEERYQKILRDVEETTKQSQERLQSVEYTLKQIDETKQQARQTVDNIDAFQKLFSDAMDRLLENIGKSLISNSIKSSEDRPKTAKLITIDEAKLLLNDQLVILCGAGLSYASGVPTFRGKDGYWTKGENTYECQKVLTKDFLDNNSQICWEWHKEFQQMLKNKKPNSGHYAIANYKIKHPKTLLVSQNIDNLLTSCLPQTQLEHGHFEQIYEIHGNINYIRCQNNCQDNNKKLATLYDMPDLTQNLQPKCPKCNGLARPHILFFDESYTDKNCRISEIQEAYKNYNIIIVVGTQLETGCAKNTVCEFIKKGAIIIEINPEPIIEVGNTFWLQGNSEEILPKLLS